MTSIQTLVWLSGSPIGRVLEHSDEEWLASIGRQVRREKEKEKKWLDAKKKNWNDWMKWCEDKKKKPSSWNYLTYKYGTGFPCMRSQNPRPIPTPKTKGDEKHEIEAGAKKATENHSENKKQHGQTARLVTASRATSDKSKPPSIKAGKSNSGKEKQDETEADEQPESAMEQPVQNTLTNEQVSQDKQPKTSAQSTTTDAVTTTMDAAKDESNDAPDTVRTGGDEVQASPLTLKQEVAELKKQIAILTIKIGVE